MRSYGIECNFRIMIGMVCVGDPLYYEMAKISVPSFCKANRSVDLVLFTDKPEMFTDCERLRIVDYMRYFNRDLELAERLMSLIDHTRCDGQYPSHKHNHIWIAMGIPIIQWYAEENGYDWAGKFDVDSYFVGDIFERLISEVGYCMDRKHFIVVEQSHPWMHCFDFDTGAATSGFQMWKVKPVEYRGGLKFNPPQTYVKRYIETFRENEQATFWARFEDGAYLSWIRLLHPGYMMTYPFAINPNFSKEDAEKFLPAYFHFGDGANPVPQQMKFKEWFE
jgi:hypothetical protein